MTLTQAEMEARYDATRLSPAILDILVNDDDDGADEEEDARELVPVPPVPAGYPTDRAMIFKSYGETFISIDRRDGEMLICTKGVPAGSDDAIILSPARALALYEFFWNDAIIELMEYHRKNAAATVAA